MGVNTAGVTALPPEAGLACGCPTCLGLPRTFCDFSAESFAFQKAPSVPVTLAGLVGEDAA